MFALLDLLMAPPGAIGRRRSGFWMIAGFDFSRFSLAIRRASASRRRLFARACYPTKASVPGALHPSASYAGVELSRRCRPSVGQPTDSVQGRGAAPLRPSPARTPAIVEVSLRVWLARFHFDITENRGLQGVRIMGAHRQAHVNRVVQHDVGVS